MARWYQHGIRISGKDGEKTITYKAQGVRAWIESRKKAVPHANGEGVWMHTTYFVVHGDGTEQEYWKLSDAKEAAEKEAAEF